MASKGPKPGSTAKPPVKASPAVEMPAVPPVLAKAEPVEIAVPKVAPAPEKKAEALKAAIAKPVAAKPVAPKPVAKVAAKPPEPAPKPVAVTPPAPVAIATPPVAKPEPKPQPAPTPVAAAPQTKPEPTETTPPPAPLQKEKTIMATTFNTAAATDKAQAFFGEANERAKAAFEKSTKLFEEMNEFSKGNLEAVVESGKIAAKGLETLGQDAAEYTRKQFEGATAIAKSFASVKSPTELFKLQSDYLRSSFDALVAESSKTTEAMLKLAGEVAQPISNRVSLAAEKVKLAA
ncbi:phasin family protein [Sphingomonas immobilis]|uniref:TIGR01841 family phasin n=1 Tax=Sphingomonas immobilis TaxID=3063997 RepID=A0ABT8ZVR7_9SPHN|nr:TIGR01841 family phasin [Sphingomonas sp. CA1-15]MDO7841664.1 TIGR01841 family phasin [Sphingomonas sp. CA1-15]